MKKFKTRNDLPEKARTQLSGLLQHHLANAIDLGMQAKQAHWNVKGAAFIALHELFDKIAEGSEEYVDLIAERIMQFGGTAEGTLQAVGQESSLPHYPLNAVSGLEHVNALAQGLAAFGEEVRTAINDCDELSDKGTADIFTEISRSVDKNLWFVEAHLQSE